MTEEEKTQWFTLFDETKGEFKWIFERYFSQKLWERLMASREKENYNDMSYILTYVWAELPDNKFNTMENPKGWPEFMALLDF